MTLDEVIKTAEERKKLRDDLKATPKDVHPRRNKLTKQLIELDRKLNRQVAELLRAGAEPGSIAAELDKRGLR